MVQNMKPLLQQRYICFRNVIFFRFPFYQHYGKLPMSLIFLLEERGIDSHGVKP